MERLEGPVQIAEEMALPRLATIREHGPKLHAGETAGSSAKASLHSHESQLQVVCALNSSLREEVAQLPLHKTCIDEHCDLEDLHGDHTRDMLDSAIETNCTLCENIREARAHCDKELADFLYEFDGLQARVAISDNCSEASFESFPVAHELWRLIEVLSYHNSAVVVGFSFWPCGVINGDP